MPSSSQANHWPVRQKPDWISSATKTMPLSFANCAMRGEEALGRLDEAALAEHRLDEDGRHVLRADLLADLVDGLCRRLLGAVLGPGQPAVGVGDGDPVDLGGEGAEAVLVGHVLRGQRHRQVRTAVVAVVEDDDRLAAGVRPGDLDGVLHRLGAGVEQRPLLGVVTGGDACQLLADLDVGLVRRDHHTRVGEGLQLGGRPPDHRLGAVAHAGHGDSGAEVDEGVAVHVLQDAAPRPLGEDGHHGPDPVGDRGLLAGHQLLRLRAGNGGDDAALLREGRATGHFLHRGHNALSGRRGLHVLRRLEGVGRPRHAPVRRSPRVVLAATDIGRRRPDQGPCSDPPRPERGSGVRPRPSADPHPTHRHGSTAPEGG